MASQTGLGHALVETADRHEREIAGCRYGDLGFCGNGMVVSFVQARLQDA